MDKLFRPRMSADEAGYDRAADPFNRRAFIAGYRDGYAGTDARPFPSRAAAYRKGHKAGKADAEREKLGGLKPSNPMAAASLRQALKNVRRTTTRRLDDAGMPEDMQGNDGKEWG